MQNTEDNTDRLVELIARGERSYARIAKELGLDEEVVAQVARGEFRPELYARIKAAQRGYVDEARRLGSRWTKSLLTKHIKVGMDSDDETARKCREYTLNEFLKTSPQKHSQAVNEASGGPKLTSRDLELLAKANDGPKS